MESSGLSLFDRGLADGNLYIQKIGSIQEARSMFLELERESFAQLRKPILQPLNDVDLPSGEFKELQTKLKKYATIEIGETEQAWKEDPYIQGFCQAVLNDAKHKNKNGVKDERFS